jgi:choloylglycine hydrolase
VSIPFGLVNPEQPNLSQTIWVTVADSKGLVYFFQSTSSPGMVWVKLGELDLSEGQPVRKLQLAGNPDLSGDQTTNLKQAEMFRFAGEN